MQFSEEREKGAIRMDNVSSLSTRYLQNDQKFSLQKSLLI